MPSKVPIITKQYLQDASLPNHGGKYTVISHTSIIKYIEDKIAQNGLVIEDCIFRAAQFGQVAAGTYHIKNEQDDEIGLMIGFVNSYNKLLRFGCTVGGYNKKYKNYYIARSVATWKRKHTGNADIEAQEHISDQIDLVSKYYDNIIKSREIMRNVALIPQLRASILGYIYFEKNLLTVDQVSQLKRNLNDKVLDYPSSNLWELYNHITMVLKSSHPKDWITSQSEVHDILLNMYCSNLSKKVNNDNESLPGQLQMFDEPDELGKYVSGINEDIEKAIDEELNGGFVNMADSVIIDTDNQDDLNIPDEPEVYDL
jgi:hypothetical protein